MVHPEKLQPSQCRMYDWLLRLERVLHENVKVAFEDIVIVHFVPLAALAHVYRGQLRLVKDVTATPHAVETVP